MSQEEFIKQVKQNVKAIRAIDDDTLLEFVVAEVVDRVSLYLNMREVDLFDKRLVRILANIACGIFEKSSKQKSSGSSEQEMAITSVSDNGQSVSYSADKVKNYLATVEDNAIFSGFESLLKPYRGVNVVS